MIRRGLTMLELLLSLALLGAIAAIVVSWTGLAAGLAANEALSRRAAADVLLSRIHDDLVVGDRVAPGRRRGPARMEMIDDRLLVRTRAAAIGAVTHEYTLDPVTCEMSRVETDSRGRGTVRRLLDGVRRFTCVIDGDERVLDVRIELDSGAIARRRSRLP